MVGNGGGCDQFGGAGLGIYPTLRSFLACRPACLTYSTHIGYTPCWQPFFFIRSILEVYIQDALFSKMQMKKYMLIFP